MYIILRSAVVNPIKQIQNNAYKAPAITQATNSTKDKLSGIGRNKTGRTQKGNNNSTGSIILWK